MESELVEVSNYFGNPKGTTIYKEGDSVDGFYII
jgi:hypothetical protein